MAHFLRVRNPTLWLSGGVLLASEMEAFDDHQSKAINGDEGGVWSPSSLVEIGGSGVKITGAFTVTGSFRVDSLGDFRNGLTVQGADLTVAQDLEVQGAARLQANVTVTNSVSVGDNVELQGDLLVGSNSTLSGNCAIGNNATIDGTCTVTGGVTCSSYLSVAGSFSVGALGSVNLCGAFAMTSSIGALTKPIACGDEGRIRPRVAIGSNTDATYSVNSVSEVLVPSGATSTSATYTLNTAGAADGDKVLFSTQSLSKGVTVTTLGAGGRNYTLNLTASPGYSWLELTFMSGGWVLSRWLTNPLFQGQQTRLLP